MSLTKYKFSPGDKYPAENAGSIDPENIVPQAAGYLTGGNNPSALSVFQALSVGNDDGKISAIINGIQYNDIPITLGVESTVESALLSKNYNYNYSGGGGATFVASKNGIYKLSKLGSNFQTASGGTVTIRTGGVVGSGDIVAQVTGLSGSGTQSASLASVVTLTPGQTYNYYVSVSNGYVYYNSSYPNDRAVFLYGYNIIPLASYNNIATIIQAAIRNATGRLETVEYNTNHFKISATTNGGAHAYILKLISPSSGTDITGNATEKYLDLGVNATETAGQGDDYNLVRLGYDGKIPQGLSKTLQNISTTARSLNTPYQNTTTKTKMVIVNIAVQAASNQVIDVQGVIGATSSPATVMSRVRDGGSSYTERMTIPIILFVPAGWYYQITTSGSYSSTPAIDNWFECDFI